MGQRSVIWLFVPPKGPGEAIWRFLVRIFVYIAVFLLGFLVLIRAVPEAATPAVTGTAWLGAKLLRAFGAEAVLEGFDIQLEKFSVTIIYECTGIYSSLIFLSCVLAYPTALRRKAAGIAWGIPTIVAINVVRVAGLAAVGNRFPKYFDLLHGYLWQVTIILVVVALWVLWLMGTAKDG